MRFLSLVLAFLAFLHGSRGETTMTVGSCDDLLAAAAATATEDVQAEVVVSEIICDSWTTFEVTNNRLKMVAGEGFSNGFGFILRRVRFLVTSGVLRVEFTTNFRNLLGENEVEPREVNGGVLYVAEGARARFMSQVVADGIVISTGTSDPSAITADVGHGGCFYNKGLLRFEDAFQAFYFSTSGAYEAAAGDGGALWNGETGKVVVKGDIMMVGSQNDISGVSKGGAIYNAGEMSAFGDAQFGSLSAAMGGVIYNSGVFKFLKGTNGFFSSDRAGLGGGHIYNTGTMLFKTGAYFSDGYSGGSGGAVFNSGSFRILGKDLSFSRAAEFINNEATTFGGAVATTVGSTLELPEDMMLTLNSIDGDSSGDNCNDIYVETATGYECQP